MRLIDADATMDTIESTTWYHINRCGELVSGANSEDDTPLYRADDIYKAVSDAPTIDIVRCKECKHRPIKEDADGAAYGFNIIDPTEESRCPCLVEDGWYSWLPEDDFYCGYGEREDE